MTTPEPASEHRPPGDPEPEVAPPRITLTPLHFPYPGPRGEGIVVALWCVVLLGPCAGYVLYASLVPLALAHGGGAGGTIWFYAWLIILVTGLLIVPPIGWIAARRAGMRRSQIAFPIVWLVGLTLFCLAAWLLHG